MSKQSIRRGAIVVLTGAGISKESGLDTFRCADGIWSRVNLEDVATPEGFARNPRLVHDFYNARRGKLTDTAITPNAAHAALARLEREWPGELLIVTQNIDDLHERAGSRNVLHMHGELKKVRCGRCGGLFEWLRDLGVEDACAGCGAVGRLRPHVVWFGEMPLGMDDIYDALGRCSLFVSVGTSGNVYPAAGFVSHVRTTTRAHTVELNLEPSTGATMFAETIYGPATDVVPAYVEAILAGSRELAAAGRWYTANDALAVPISQLFVYNARVIDLHCGCRAAPARSAGAQCEKQADRPIEVAARMRAASSGSASKIGAAGSIAEATALARRLGHVRRGLTVFAISMSVAIVRTGDCTATRRSPICSGLCTSRARNS